MSDLSAQIARDIVVASVNRREVPLDGKKLGELYKEVLLAVGEAIRAEDEKEF